MKYEFKPYESVLGLTFGKTRKEIIDILNIEPNNFEKTPGEIVDDFKFMHVYYKNNKSVAYEIFSDIDIVFENINLTNNTIENLTNKFKELDDNLEIDYYGFTSYKYGFNIYGESNEVESLLVFEKDYYNN